MAKKSGNFFEQNIDKIVLAVMVLISLAILVLMVVRSPNRISIDKKSYGPGEIDVAIAGKVTELDAKLAAPAQPRSYTSRFDEFRSSYASAVKIAQGSQLPIPAPAPEKPPFYTGPYREPRMPRLARPVAGIVTGVAGVPIGATLDLGLEPADVDLVTLQSSFNANALFTQMAEAFNKEAALQTPLFAAIELQRQEMNEDGTWPGDVWQTVPLIKVDPYGDILEVEKIKTMPVSEAEALRTQLMAGPVAINVLQPVAYDFMSRTAQWLPPEFEDERVKQEERQLTTGPMSGEGGPTGTTPTRPSTGRPGGATGMEAESRTRTPAGRTPPPSAPARPTPPTRQPGGTTMPPRPGMPGMGEGGTGTLTPEQKFDMAKIVNIDLLGTMQQVVVWAHDDTVVPGKTYRYRMRLGMLNPIAGRGKSTVDPTLADKLVFWGDFTGDLNAKEPYPVVNVPARLYLFPTKIRETDNMVTVEVAKYKMARWEKKAYEIKPGETIGRLEKLPPTMDSTGNYITLPDVDFSTGITFLDVETITENRPNTANPVTYQQMVYRDTDNTVRYLPIKGSSWPKILRDRYRDIEAAIRKQPLVPVSYTGTGTSYTAPSMPSMPMMPGGGAGGMREE